MEDRGKTSRTSVAHLSIPAKALQFTHVRLVQAVVPVSVVVVVLHILVLLALLENVHLMVSGHRPCGTCRTESNKDRSDT